MNIFLYRTVYNYRGKEKSCPLDLREYLVSAKGELGGGIETMMTELKLLKKFTICPVNHRRMSH